MRVNSRFAVAVHILALLALNPEQSLSSGFIAGSVNTHPVFVRRILSLLRKSGLVATHLGTEGGSTLAHGPEQITLLDVYHITEPGPLFALHNSPPSALCPCGRNIQPILRREFQRAEAALEASLAQTTIAGVVQRIQARL